MAKNKVTAEPQQTVNTNKPPTKKKYLTNASLLVEIKKSHEQNKMTHDFAKMIQLLAYRYAQRGQYASYSYINDMQAFAVMTVVKVWRSFDPKKGTNPFAYFTQSIKHAFFQYLNTERKQRDTRDALSIQQGINPSFSYLENDSGDDDYNYYNYHNSEYYNTTSTTDED